MVLAIAVSFVALGASADNAIQRENRKPGNPEWVLANEANGEIEGYASPLSVNRGEQVRIYVNTVDTSYTMNVYRMGWYGGDGARLVAGPITRTGVRQTIPPFDPVTGLVDCNWVDPYVLTIPNTSDATEWASGVYIVRLQSNQTNKTKFVIFYVRDDARVANHLFISSTNTSQAYNAWGGRSLYPDPPTNRPAGRKVSYNRPFDSGGGTGQFLFRWEYHMVRFLEREGYDVTYATDIDLHRRNNLLPNYQSALFVGHPEYWSWEMRQNTEAARNAGTNLGFFSGNSIYWQIRYEPSAVTGEADRTIVGYKEVALTQDPYATDNNSSNDHLVTTQWRLAPVNRPEAALMGVQYVYNTIINGDIVIDDVTSAPRVFTNTGLARGSILPKLLGYEVDAMAASSPAGTIRLGKSPFFNENTDRTDYSHMTVYTHSSGATVFATGTIQWSWGLDAWHSTETGAGVVPAAQQMTRNVLARLAGDTAWRDCQYVLAPQEADVTSAAGSGSFTMTTSSNCTWNVATTAPWITITSATSGSGNTTVTYSYTANAAGPRTGDITIGDKSFSVNQDTGCSYTLSPATATAPATGTSGSFSVQTTAPCPWSAASDAAWLTISGSATGQGNATISYNVAPNDSTQRTGHIVVGGRTFTVTQDAGCTYTLSASSANVAPSGGTVSVNVTTNSACHWSASSSPSWVTITSTNHGPGNGTVTFTVAANTTSFSRVGSLSIAGNAFTVTQAAAGAP
ncbi:MAG TPA: BACON domain-containing protein, partial [Thermoanaerobaculia bacterium]